MPVKKSTTKSAKITTIKKTVELVVFEPACARSVKLEIGPYEAFHRWPSKVVHHAIKYHCGQVHGFPKGELVDLAKSILELKLNTSPGKREKTVGTAKVFTIEATNIKLKSGELWKIRRNTKHRSPLIEVTDGTGRLAIFTPEDLTNLCEAIVKTFS